MNTAANRTERVATVARRLRIVGWLLFAAGVFALADVLPAFLDREATILAEGNPTNDPTTKLTALHFVLGVSVIGAILALTPSRLMTGMMTRTEEIGERIVGDRDSRM